MKKILTITAFALLALSAAGQKTIVSQESAYRYGYNPAEQDSMFFESKVTVYSDGSVDSDESPVQDTVSLINTIAVAAVNKAKRFTRTAAEVWEYPAIITYILQANTLLGQFGTSVTRWTVDQYGEQFDSTAWEIRVPAGTTAAQLTIHPNGNQFRLTAGGTNYNLLPVGDALFRINNYPSQGVSTDFFRLIGAGYIEFRTIDYRENGSGAVTAGTAIRKQP